MNLFKQLPLFRRNKLALFFWIILALSIWLRFYNLSNFAGFAWDQEQLLAYPVKNIITNHKLYLIGPETGPGGIHLGPLIYYLAVPFFWAFKLHPIAGSVLASTLGIFTGLLFYLVLTPFFKSRLGLIGYAIYAVSPLINFNDRTIWNPSLIPLASLGVLIAQLNWWRYRRLTRLNLGLLATSMALGVQAHLGFIFTLPVAIFSLIYLRLLSKLNFGKCAWFVGILLVWFSPLIIFDLRHQGVNLNSLLKFLDTGSVNFNLVTHLTKSLRVLQSLIQMLGGLAAQFRFFKLEAILGSAVIVSAWIFRRHLNSQLVNLFLIWLITYALGFSFYQGNIPEYYLWPMLLPGLLIISLLLNSLLLHFKVALPVFLAMLIMFLMFQTLELISTTAPDSLQHKLQTVQHIIAKSQGQHFRVVYDTDFGRNAVFSYRDC